MRWLERAEGYNRRAPDSNQTNAATSESAEREAMSCHTKDIRRAMLVRAL